MFTCIFLSLYIYKERDIEHIIYKEGEFISTCISPSLIVIRSHYLKPRTVPCVRELEARAREYPDCLALLDGAKVSS